MGLASTRLAWLLLVSFFFIKVIQWVSEWFSGWMTDFLSECVSEWVNVRVGDWLTDWLIDWMSKWVCEYRHKQMGRWCDITLEKRRNFIYQAFKNVIQCLGLVQADVYLHNPRGSNNRLNGQGRARSNNNRLFDSQNNNRGGYNVGEGSLTYYEGSNLEVWWWWWWWWWWWMMNDEWWMMMMMMNDEWRKKVYLISLKLGTHVAQII